MTFAAPTEPPLQSDYATGKADRKQTVLKLTMDSWNQLKEAFHIEKAYLPHRQPGNHPTGRQQTQSSQGASQQESQQSQSQSQNQSNGIHESSRKRKAAPKKKNEKNVSKKQKISSGKEEVSPPG